MQTTIMSRFDAIFLVRDVHDEARDRVCALGTLNGVRLLLPITSLTFVQSIAKHVMNLHQNLTNDNETVGEIDIDKMRRYLSFVKS
jgi:DNA replication licensing factor MCM5